MAAPCGLGGCLCLALGVWDSWQVCWGCGGEDLGTQVGRGCGGQVWDTPLRGVYLWPGHGCSVRGRAERVLGAF